MLTLESRQRRAATPGHRAHQEALGVLVPPGGIRALQRADHHHLVRRRRRRVLLADLPAGRMGNRAVLPRHGRLPTPRVRGTDSTRDEPTALTRWPWTASLQQRLGRPEPRGWIGAASEEPRV